MYEEFFRKRLTQLRMDRNDSAREMSLSIGQNDGYINRIENGKMLPKMQPFFNICEHLGITPQEFFDEGNAYPERMRLLVEAAGKLDESDFAMLLDLAHKLARK